MHKLMLIAPLLFLAGCDQIPKSSETGRYTITHSPHVQRDTMLLDTATGRTWNLVTFNKGPDTRYGWEPVAKIDPDLEGFEYPPDNAIMNNASAK
jgi:hypothetical protein